MVHVPAEATEVATPEVATTVVEPKKSKKAKKAVTVPTEPSTEGTAPEAKKAPAVPKVKDPNALTGREALALHYIAGTPRIGAELGVRMGKGISRLMGCAVKNGGVSAGLCGRGFAVVKAVPNGDGTALRHEYHITDTGRAALELVGDLTEAAAAGEAKAVETLTARATAKAEKAAPAVEPVVEPVAQTAE